MRLSRLSNRIRLTEWTTPTTGLVARADRGSLWGFLPMSDGLSSVRGAPRCEWPADEEVVVAMGEQNGTQRGAGKARDSIGLTGGAEQFSVVYSQHECNLLQW